MCCMLYTIFLCAVHRDNLIKLSIKNGPLTYFYLEIFVYIVNIAIFVLIVKPFLCIFYQCQ